MRLKHLSGRKTCDHVLRKGNVWKGSMFTVRWLPGAPRNLAAAPRAGAVYLGTFASGKVDASAVKRNRMRRRCREAFRLAIADAETLPSVQLLVAPRSASLDAPFPLIRNEVKSFLDTLAVWHKKAALPGFSSSR